MRAKAIDTEAGAGAGAGAGVGARARTSVDSTRSSSRAMGAGGVDLIYLKNVLLQFMELKDKRQQQQLVPALKMLLDLDSKEERKWLQAVQAR